MFLLWGFNPKPPNFYLKQVINVKLIQGGLSGTKWRAIFLDLLLKDKAEFIFKQLSLSATECVKNQVTPVLSQLFLMKLSNSSWENYSLPRSHNTRKTISFGKAIWTTFYLGWFVALSLKMLLYCSLEGEIYLRWSW